MNKRASKIVLTALSLAVALGAAIGISASANSTAPEIVSKNIMVNGNYALMFAVDPATVAGDNVTLNVYAEAPAEGVSAVQTITKAKTDLTNIALDGDGIEDDAMIVFETRGVSAKDIADVWYITTTSNGVTSEVETYSVREYAFERLYKNGTVFATETEADLTAYYQQQFYLELLDVGSAAQQLLVNYDLEKEGKPTEKLAKEYIYAAVIGGTYTMGDVTADRGFVDNKATLTLTSTDTAVKGWDVYTFGQNGGLISTQTVADGDTVEVKGNIAAVPYKLGVTAGKYFDEIGNSVYTMDGFDYLNFQGNKSGGQQVKPYYLAHTSYATNGANYLTTDSGDPVHGAIVGGKKTADAGAQSLLHFPIAAATDANANCVVFEYDFYYTGMDLYYNSATTAGKQTSNSTFYQSFNSNDLATAAGKGWNGLSKTASWEVKTYDLDGVTAIPEGGSQYKSGVGENAMKLPGSEAELEANKWYNVCYELYVDAGVWVIYLDGVQVSSGKFTAQDIANYNTFSFMMDYRIKNFEMYIDNVYGGKIVKTYVAP